MRNRRVPRGTRPRHVVAAAEYFSNRSRCRDDACFGKLGQRVRQPFRIGVFIVIGGALKTEGILHALLRVVRTNHPRPGTIVVLVFRCLARARPAAQFGDPWRRRWR
jgi:hypothetical protein